MYKICFVTSTRAEYGLLRPLMKVCLEEPSFETKVVVTGTHLSREFGYTVEEIQKDHMPIDKEIVILQEGAENPTYQVMGSATSQFGEYFTQTQPDLLIVLGDRYEMLAICLGAAAAGIPIAHLHGGEITKGAKDDAYRHCITKLSHLHFTSTREYANRVIQLGESPDRVFHVGALGVENCMKEELLTEEEFKKDLGIPMEHPYAMVTFHPATLELSDAIRQVRDLLDAMVTQENMYYVISKANADEQGQAINRTLEEYIESGKTGSERLILRASLGMKRYLSGIKYSSFVLGNSSSGILEAPTFKVPTINIGSRQEGRTQAESVINCNADKEEIIDAIKQALNPAYREGLKDVVNPYGDGETSTRILTIIKEELEKGISRVKDFYDLQQ